MKNYSKWTKDFMESWKNLEGVKTTELFSKDVEYYETPLGKPCQQWSEVEALWSVVTGNQQVLSYDFQIICENENVCVINWQMERIMNGKNQKIDGIFQISLNDEGKLTYFKQWRATV